MLPRLARRDRQRRRSRRRVATGSARAPRTRRPCATRALIPLRRMRHEPDPRRGETTSRRPRAGTTRRTSAHVPPRTTACRPWPLVVVDPRPRQKARSSTRPRRVGPTAPTWSGSSSRSPAASTPAGASRPCSADVVFLTQLLDELEAQLCVDTNRVYIEGYSLGALMTSRSSCTLADRVAAVAPLAGVYAVSGCAPSKPVPLSTFHGTLDTFIPYEPIPGQVADWAARTGAPVPRRRRTCRVMPSSRSRSSRIRALRVPRWSSTASRTAVIRGSVASSPRARSSR